MPTDPYSLKKRVERFIGDPSEDDLDGLALAVFGLQFEHIEGYRRFCVGRQATPESVQRWQDIPMIPTPAFKSTVFCVGQPVEVFRSSGTTVGGERSAHHHPFPDLYRRSIDATFPNFCRIGSDLPSMLSLIPSRLQAPDSSLSFMIDHVLSNFAGSGTLHAIGRRGVEAGQTAAHGEFTGDNHGLDGIHLGDNEGRLRLAHAAQNLEQDFEFEFVENTGRVLRLHAFVYLHKA